MVLAIVKVLCELATAAVAVSRFIDVHVYILCMIVAYVYNQGVQLVNVFYDVYWHYAGALAGSYDGVCALVP